jgi:fermentation-respiration switch protein FrsA (DUF1100 family)
MRIAGLALVAAVAMLMLIWTFQRRLMYFPFPDVLPPGAVGLPGAEPAVFTADDGIVLHGWFVSGRRPGALDGTAILFNGNAGNRSYRGALAARLSGQGMNVLLFDYRGYGENQGSPSEEGLARDARAALRYATGRADVDPRRLVYFGESLGTAVAVRLAVERPPSALVLRSPFASMAEIAAHHYPYLPVRWLLRDRYASIDRIARLDCPLLVIAGRSDTIVPFSHSERLFAAATAPKRLVALPALDHNDEALLAGPEVIREIVAFVRGVQ